MIGPILGLVLIIILTVSYLNQINRQNELIRDIAHQDLELLGHYTDMFTQLSNNHIALYELLNKAGKDLDEGEVYDRGTSILDNIVVITKELEQIENGSSQTLGVKTLNKESLNIVSEYISKYRNACISAVEMVTVALELAPKYLSKADKHFLFIHENFSKNLSSAREEIRLELENKIQDNRLRSHKIVVVGLMSAIAITIFGYFISLFLSRRLQEQINKLKEIRKSQFKDDLDDTIEREVLDEVSEIDKGIKLFEYLLDTVRKQEEELSNANKELELKVKRRTDSLSKVNEILKVEISQRDIIEKELHIFKKMFDSTDEAVLICDDETNIININKAFVKCYGYSYEEVIGKKPNLLSSGHHNEKFYKEIWVGLNAHGYWSGEIWDKRKNGEVFPQWVTINAVYDVNKNVTQYISLYRDISEIKETEKRLEHLAFYDALTGLPNRILFNERLNHEILNAKRNGKKLAVLFIDLDRFKYVNDTLGHSFGDDILVGFGFRILGALRECDTVSRLGGDEFTVIASDIEDDKAAEATATKIIDALRQPVMVDSHELHVGGSIGIAMYPEHGGDAETLKSHADLAMYKAKTDGRNRYSLYNDSLKQESAQHLSLLSDLTGALENNEFSLVYQPILDLKTKQPVSAEALIRWTQKDGVSVSPVHFIPMAEESGVVEYIDQWVLETACKEAMLWQDIYGKPLHVNVNLSSSFFQKKENPELLEKILSKTGYSPKQLCLEITETAVISNPQLAKTNLHAITEMGACIALDDFGTGFSSLNHLLHFPLSRIKIDRSFIKNMDADIANEAIVRSLIDLANNLDLNVVAEGVETLAHHELLVKLKCQYGQGYYYSKPVSSMEFRNWLESFNIKPQNSSGVG
jgi:diguanylate cyclase (GGDEF)-like protein/PAS domain S-box-containing protein